MKMDDLFGAFRGKPGPTLYGEQFNPVEGDIRFAAILTLAVIFAVSFLLTLCGLPLNQRLRVSVKGFFAAGVALTILLCIFGQEWKSSSVHTRAIYKAYNGKEVMGEVGIYIGLRYVNVTLKGIPEVQGGERINYNERFWLHTDAKVTSGLAPGFKMGLKMGMPLPILNVAEYLAFDGGGFRWGRKFRDAGYFTGMLMWSAFALWLYTCLLYMVSPGRGAVATIITGVFNLLACLVYAAMQPPRMSIPFRDGFLDCFKGWFGWCFWVNFVTGLLLFIFGLFIVTLYNFNPEFVSDFFMLESWHQRHQETEDEGDDEDSIVSAGVDHYMSNIESGKRKTPTEMHDYEKIRTFGFNSHWLNVHDPKYRASVSSARDQTINKSGNSSRLYLKRKDSSGDESMTRSGTRKKGPHSSPINRQIYLPSIRITSASSNVQSTDL